MAKKGKSVGVGTVGYFAVFAGIIALAYLAVYLSAGISDVGNFSRMWMDLVVGLLFLGTALLIFKNRYYGWILYIVSLCAILVRCLMALSVGELPLMVLAIFALMHLLSDDVRSKFGD